MMAKTLNNMLMHVLVQMLALRSENMEQVGAVIAKRNCLYINPLRNRVDQ